MTLPAELQEIKKLPQWVAHKNKIPVNPHTGKNGSSTDPSTWGSYEEAEAAVDRYRLDGVGFVFAGGYFGIDIDHCISERGHIKKEAADLVKAMDSYTEYSPSGTGLHIICKGSIPAAIGAAAKKGFEMYESGRYFTVTGRVYKEPKEIEERTDRAAKVYAYYMGNNENSANNVSGVYNGNIESGSRNSTLIAIAGSLRSKGVGREAIIETLQQINKNQCKPPLSEREFNKAVLSALDRAFAYDNKYTGALQQPVKERKPYTPEPIGAYMETFDSFCNEDSDNISTGILSLDMALNGGLSDELYILGAETGQGKSALSMHIAQEIAAAGHDVLYFALEMSKRELIARGISALTYTMKDSNPYTAGNILYYRWDNAAQTFTKLAPSCYAKAKQEYFKRYAETLYIFENSEDSFYTANDIDYIARQHKEITGHKPIVFVDYLQMIAADQNDRTQTGSTKAKVDAAVRVLKALSREMPVFTISSINRQGYGKRITAQSFKESGDLEYTGGVLLGLNLDAQIKKYEDADAAEKAIKEANEAIPRKMTLEVLKFRNGVKNNDIALNYYAAFNYFEIDPVRDRNSLANSFETYKENRRNGKGRSLKK